jgi:hypothetical protein
MAPAWARRQYSAAGVAKRDTKYWPIMLLRQGTIQRYRRYSGPGAIPGIIVSVGTTAGVAELADAQDLGSCGRKAVKVQILSSAPSFMKCLEGRAVRFYDGLYLS